MKKANFKRSLALLLSVMVLLTSLGGALSVFADDAAAGDAVAEPDYVLNGGGVDLVGTEEEGIKITTGGANQAVHNATLHGKVIDGMPNGDFQQGFKYWAAVKAASAEGPVTATPSEYMTLITEEDGNKYLQYKSNVGTYKGLMSPDIAISDDYISDGDKLTVIYDYKTTATTYNVQIGFQQRNIVSGGSTTLYAWNKKDLAYKADGWNTAGDKNNTYALTVSERSEGTSYGYSESGYYTFTIRVENTTADCTTAIDNIKIVKVVDNKYYDIYTGEEIVLKNGTNTGYVLNAAGDLVGTEEAGITSKSDGNYDSWAIEGMPNGDFQKGFKYWAGNTEAGPSIYFNLVTEEDGNKYIQYKGSSIGDTYKGLKSPDIAIADEYLSDGDQIVVLFDYKGTDSYWQWVVGQRVSTVSNNIVRTNKTTGYGNNAATTLAICTNGWTTAATAPLTVAERGTNRATAGGLNSGYYAFYISLENANVACTTAFDNIRLAKVSNGKYYDIYTGEQLTFKSTAYSDGTPVGGTYENGWTVKANSSSHVPSYVGPYDSFENGDFSSGLKYWAPRVSSATSTAMDATRNASIVTEGDNTYVQLFSTDPENDGTYETYKGIQSLQFAIDGAKAGDKYVLLYKYRNGDLSKYEIKLTVLNTDSTWGYSSQNNGAVILQNANGSQWGWARAEKVITVGSTVAAGSSWYVNNASYRNAELINAGGRYTVEISNAKAEQLQIDLDDFMVVKYIDDYTFETLDGEAITFDPLWAGTYENGIETSLGEVSQVTNQAYNTYGVVNGDFSAGLKYWGSNWRTDTTAYASDTTEVVVDGDNTYIRFNGNVCDGYAGIVTPKISIPASQMQKGDYAAVKFDVYDPDSNAANIQVRIDFRGSTHDVELSNNQINDAKLIEDKGNGWKTYVTTFKNAIDEISDKGIAEGDWAFTIQFAVKSSYTDEEGNYVAVSSTAGIDNIEIVRADRGGFGADAPAVALDGSVLADAVMGDANNDGKVDLIDLVRTKKYAVNASSGDAVPAIVFAYADTDATGAVDAGDFTAIINKILGI